MTVKTLLISSTLLATAAAQFPYEKPAKRFIDFNSLSATDQNTASSLGYTAATWNVPATASIEELGWWQFTDAQKSSAGALGFTEGQWDCFINHYLTYTWDDLIAEGKDAHFEALGWTQAAWEGSGDSPDTESKWWGQLTTSEKAAANQLCYFQENWNQVDMTPNPSYYPFPFPAFRYVPYDELSESDRSIAETSLGYTSAGKWDWLGNNTAESDTFLNLDSTQRDGALELGFSMHQWNCFINHFDAMYWDSLYGATLIAAETLGWDEDMWTNRKTWPASEETFWDDLTPQERAAATALCYFKESWDADDDLTTFYDYDAKQTKAIPSNTVPSNMDFSIFGGQGSPGSNWVPGQVGAQTASSHIRAVSVFTTGLAVLISAFVAM